VVLSLGALDHAHNADSTVDGWCALSWQNWPVLPSISCPRRSTVLIYCIPEQPIWGWACLLPPCTARPGHCQARPLPGQAVAGPGRCQVRPSTCDIIQYTKLLRSQHTHQYCRHPHLKHDARVTGYFDARSMLRQTTSTGQVNADGRCMHPPMSMVRMAFSLPCDLQHMPLTVATTTLILIFSALRHKRTAL
jgi:hypothetical protein